MKIAFFEINRWEKEMIKKSLKGNAIKFFKEPLTEENLRDVKDIEILSVFIFSHVSKEVIDRLPKLKMIVTRSTGFDHIDINHAKRKKIIVCNRPFYGDNTVAEHTFALILTLTRNVHKSYLRTLRNDYSTEGLQGTDLEGKTLGVVGVGRIGKHVVRIARGFNMKVLAYDHHEDEFLAEQLNFKYVPLKILLKKSDIVTIHVPYNKENHHMFSKKTFSLMKKHSLLINTARGGLVDTDDLLWAMDKKIVAGVGLDVLEGENLIKEEKQLLYDRKKREELEELAADHVLLSRDNVVFTPHIAFYSKEALERIIHNTIENIKCFKSRKINKECIVC